MCYIIFCQPFYLLYCARGAHAARVLRDSSHKNTHSHTHKHNSLHQPIYRNMHEKPAIFFKCMNLVVALLLCASALYRLFASFGGHIVEVRCKETVIKGLMVSNSTSCNGAVDVECSKVLPFVTVSPDGFELFVQSSFVAVLTVCYVCVCVCMLIHGFDALHMHVCVCVCARVCLCVRE
jgi:hypothetical protein